LFIGIHSSNVSLYTSGTIIYNRVLNLELIS